MDHTANIKKVSTKDAVILKGEFEVVAGKLSFTCHTQNVTFDEVLNGLTLLRDELNRQIDNQTKCPFHPGNAKGGNKNIVKCEQCGKEFEGEDAQYCCSGRDCGCMGMPVNGPCVCSEECYTKLVGHA